MAKNKRKHPGRRNISCNEVAVSQQALVSLSMEPPLEEYDVPPSWYEDCTYFDEHLSSDDCVSDSEDPWMVEKKERFEQRYVQIFLLELHFSCLNRCFPVVTRPFMVIHHGQLSLPVIGFVFPKSLMISPAENLLCFWSRFFVMESTYATKSKMCQSHTPNRFRLIDALVTFLVPHFFS